MASLPDSHRDLLDAPGVAVLTTITPSGQLQSTAVWYLLDDDATVKISSTGDRKKLRNVQADPRVTLLFMDPATPTRTLEVRGTASTALDDGLVVQKKIGAKYESDVTSFDPPGTIRYVIAIEPDTVNTFG
jgi:PPOX class probable F420-dependent enzyme